ncbi:MAG: hypothetical protein IPL61_13315 [Myxococcales bacterium]|nr:hypothetical protein [Myxococcales bacterium]
MSEIDVGYIPPASRWSGIVGGVLVAASLWLVLHFLGMGIGLTAIDPDDASSLSAAGIGAGVWSLFAPILALFVGGLVVSRMSPTPSRVNRLIQGALVWSISTLVAVTLIVSIVSSLVAGVASAGAKAAGAVAGAATAGAVGAAGAVEGTSLSSLGLDGDDLLAPINERLRAEGKPAVTARQLEAAGKQTLEAAVHSGKLDRQMLATALVKNTALTQQDVRDLAAQIDQRYQELTQRAAEMATRAQEAALQAAETTGKAIMSICLALLLGLGGAIGGALLTGRFDRRRNTTWVNPATIDA